MELLTWPARIRYGNAHFFPVERNTMNQPTTPTDLELLQQMTAGNEEAFAALYRRMQGCVYRFAVRMSGSETVAEDVTQEVFMTLIHEAHRYDPTRGPLLTYLYGVTRNLVLRRLQRDRSYVPLPDAQDEGEAPLDERLMFEGDPLVDLTRNEVIETVRQAVLTLPIHYREVVVLCDLHEMSYEEAAEVLGCAVGTIRSRLHRGRALLVQKLRSSDRADANFRRISPEGCLA